MQQHVLNKMYLVGKRTPDSLGLRVQLEKAFVKAKACKQQIILHKGFHPELEGIIDDRFFLPKEVELAECKDKKFAFFWDVPECDVDQLKTCELVDTQAIPRILDWLKGDSRIFYDMCIAEGLRVVAFYVRKDRLSTEMTISLAIDIDFARKKFEI